MGGGILHFKIFLRLEQKSSKSSTKIFFDPPKNKKKPRSKKVRYIGFMENFNM